MSLYSDDHGYGYGIGDVGVRAWAVRRLVAGAACDQTACAAWCAGGIGIQDCQCVCCCYYQQYGRVPESLSALNTYGQQTGLKIPNGVWSCPQGSGCGAPITGGGGGGTGGGGTGGGGTGGGGTGLSGDSLLILGIAGAAVAVAV